MRRKLPAVVELEDVVTFVAWSGGFFGFLLWVSLESKAGAGLLFVSLIVGMFVNLIATARGE